MEKVLFVVAHPDDAEVIYGQAIHSHKSEKPHVIVATDGKASTVDHIGDNFVARGGRRCESERGLMSLGISRDRQHYLEMEDGELPRTIPQLAARLSSIAVTHEAKIIYSFGPGGFDGHSDHAATFHATRMVTEAQHLQHYARSDNMVGAIEFAGDEAVKIQAMAEHRSQYDLTDPNFLSEEFSLYTPQFRVERYNLVSPASVPVEANSERFLQHAVA